MRVYRLDLVTGRREMRKEYEPDPSQTAGGIPLALTPDGRWLLFTQLDQYGKDILLVENFR